MSLATELVFFSLSVCINPEKWHGVALNTVSDSFFKVTKLKVIFLLALFEILRQTFLNNFAGFCWD